MTMEYPRPTISNTRLFVSTALLVAIVVMAGIAILHLPVGPDPAQNLAYILSAIGVISVAGTAAMFVLLWMDGPHRMK